MVTESTIQLCLTAKKLLQDEQTFQIVAKSEVWTCRGIESAFDGFSKLATIWRCCSSRNSEEAARRCALTIDKTMFHSSFAAAHQLLLLSIVPGLLACAQAGLFAMPCTSCRIGTSLAAVRAESSWAAPKTKSIALWKCCL